MTDISQTLKLPTLAEIRAAHAERLVTVRGINPIIVNYTPKAQYDRIWNDVTMTCRGLILRVDRPWPHSTAVEEVVALPFTKFFNVGERGEPESPVVEVTEKADGCLGIIFRINGAYRIATRGSLSSTQALWATEFLKRYDLSGLPDNLTLLFEVIFPGSHIVVNYGGLEDLVLLGVRDRLTGADWFHGDVARLGSQFGFSVIPTVNLTLDQAIEGAASLDANAEGWVIRCQDGTRWKIKGSIYRELHRFLSHLSERAVIDAMLAGTYDELLNATPSAYADQVIRWHQDTLRELGQQTEEVARVFANAPRETRKDFALWVTANHKPLAPYLFAMLDEREIQPMLLKAIRETRSPEPLVNASQ